MQNQNNNKNSLIEQQNSFKIDEKFKNYEIHSFYSHMNIYGNHNSNLDLDKINIHRCNLYKILKQSLINKEIKIRNSKNNVSVIKKNFFIDINELNDFCIRIIFYDQLDKYYQLYIPDINLYGNASNNYDNYFNFKLLKIKNE